MPTGPAALGYTQAMQRDFYRALEGRLPPARGRAFAYFAAFDAPWRVKDFNPVPGTHPEEAFWGLYTDGRAPKPVVEGLAPLEFQGAKFQGVRALERGSSALTP